MERYSRSGLPIVRVISMAKARELSLPAAQGLYPAVKDAGAQVSCGVEGDIAAESIARAGRPPAKLPFQVRPCRREAEGGLCVNAIVEISAPSSGRIQMKAINGPLHLRYHLRQGAHLMCSRLHGESPEFASRVPLPFLGRTRRRATAGVLRSHMRAQRAGVSGRRGGR